MPSNLLVTKDVKITPLALLAFTHQLKSSEWEMLHALTCRRSSEEIEKPISYNHRRWHHYKLKLLHTDILHSALMTVSLLFTDDKRLLNIVHATIRCFMVKFHDLWRSLLDSGDEVLHPLHSNCVCT
jgi:hypothetical protein